MTSDQIQAIYRELQDLMIPVKLELELGPEYFRERLTLVHHTFERATELLIAVTRAMTTVRIEQRSLTAAIKLDPSSAQARAMRETLEEGAESLEDLKGLYAAIKLRREGARLAGTNIRLMGRLMEQERQLPASPESPQARNTLASRPATADEPGGLSPAGAALLGLGTTEAVEALLGPTAPAVATPTPAPTVVVEETIDIAELLKI